MELLFSNFPPVRTQCRKFSDCFYEQLQLYRGVDISVGYITADSLTELKRVVENNDIHRLNLTIGMHYFERFTALEYNAAMDLNDFLNAKSTETDWHILVCRALMVVVVVVAYPMAMLPASAGIVRYLPKHWNLVKKHNGFFATLLVKLCLLILTTFCSSFITNIGAIFSIGSAIFAIFICYIGPLSTIMLWPRIEKFGNPEFRKLSVVDTILYNKTVGGKPYFENKEVENALIQNGNNSQSNDVVVAVEEEHDKSSDDKKENETLHFTVDKKQFEDEDLIQLQKKTMKLPYVPIPKWRYVVFITAMFICVVLSVLSVVGTFVG